MNSAMNSEPVAAYAQQQFSSTLERLKRYLAIPAISCDKAHEPDVRRLASMIKDDLTEFGFPVSKVLELEGALPCVYAEWIVDPQKPTILIYGHLDLQPVKGEAWDSPPHHPVIKPDAEHGDRLIARGAADDMGGWLSHLVALEAWLKTHHTLPCNIKLVIEGEEEIGSPNLSRFMDAYPECFKSSAMVLTDCENPSTDIPGLTTSLRGLHEVTLTCESMRADIHSGLWGNMVPDPTLALMKIVSRLTDDDGRLKYGRQAIDPAWQKAAWDVPLSDDNIRHAARLVDNVNPIAHRDHPPAEWLWRQPAVTVLTSTIPPLGHEKNAIRKSASAVLSFRIAPGQTAEELMHEVKPVLLDSPPAGIKVSIESDKKHGSSWLYTPKGPAFEAADRAYEKAWGRKLLHIGIGGSIPFVALFGQRFSDLPLILNGVMDPETGAHGPNESLHLGVLQKAILANVYLYEELAQVL